METFIPAPAIREICEIRGQNNRRFQVEDSSLKDAEALERIRGVRSTHPGNGASLWYPHPVLAIGSNASGVPQRRDHGFQVPPQHRRRMADVADRDGFPQGRRGAGKTGRGSRRSRCCKPNLHSFAPSRLRAKPSRWCECFARGREDAKDLGGEAMRQICPFDKSTGEPRALRIGRAGVWHHGPRMDGGGHPRQVPARWFDMESPVEGSP